MKAVYSAKKCHSEAAPGYKSDTGLKKMWGLVLRKCARVKNKKKGGKKTREVHL